jgi:hypothetical protein
VADGSLATINASKNLRLILGEKVVRNDAWEAREETITKTAELIVKRHPAADVAQVLSFVEAQFNAMAADPNARITVDVLVQQYENVSARQVAGDPRVMMRMEKVLFKCLVRRDPHVSVQMAELSAAYQTQTQEPLRNYFPELGAVLESLQEREFISVKKPGVVDHPLFFKASISTYGSGK